MFKMISILIVFSQTIVANGFPDTTKIPAKWKQESVIILNFKHKYNVDPSKNTKQEVNVVYYIRDKWGLDELSLLDLPTDIEGNLDTKDISGDKKSPIEVKLVEGKKNENNIGNVYKRDGRIIPISMDNLIPRKTTIDFSNANSQSRKGLSIEASHSQKLAVPSLGIGDVLELNYTSESQSRPSFLVLINKFPVLHFETSVHLETGYTYGVPAIELFSRKMNTEVPLAYDNDKQITVELDSLDKFKEEILSDNNRQIPYILIGYRYASSGSSDNANKSYKSMDKEYASQVQLAIVRNIYASGGNQKSIASQISSALHKKYPKITDTVAYVNDAYYLYREIIAKNNLYNGLPEGTYKGDKFFVSVMTRVLFAKRIYHKVFISQPDYFSGVKKPDDFIEAYYGVFIPGKQLYLFNPLYAYEPGNVPSYFENQEFVSFSANKLYKKYHYFWYFWLFPPAGALTLPLTLPPYLVTKARAEKHRKFDFDEGHFPSTRPENNCIQYDIKIKNFDFAANSLEFERKSSYYGKLKLSETNKICAASYLYENTENPYRKMLSVAPVKIKADQSDIDKLEKYLRDMVKNGLDDDGYDIKKFNSFRVNDANFFDKTKPFVHTSSFTANELVWNYNNYILLNAGRIIGQQLVVPEKSKDRQQNFYIPFPKQFSCSITIPIPDGYSVENLSDFNIKKNTSAGGFISEARIEKNQVIINTKKTYFFNFFAREDASDIYDYLYEAEKFYNKKMLFRKK